jgi:hypothetical protein
VAIAMLDSTKSLSIKILKGLEETNEKVVQNEPP